MSETALQSETAKKEKQKTNKGKKFKFTCEGCGAKSGASPKLTIPPPGIKIIFLRYGLVLKDSKTIHYPESKVPVSVNPHGAPAIEGYRYVKKLLRPEGHIYILDEETKKISKIDINSYQDNRFTLVKNTIIWAAYSEVD